jgi:hypothetical protein
MWLATVFFFVQLPCLPEPKEPPEPPSVVIHVVESESRVPLVGATVKILSGNTVVTAGYTDKDGNAKFWLAEDNDYEIEAKEAAFRTKHLKRVHLRNAPSAPAQLQVKLKFAGRPVTVW